MAPAPLFGVQTPPKVGGGDRRVQVPPQLPAVRHSIGQLDVHDAGPLPVLSPPGRRMQTPQIRSPPLSKMLGNRTLDLPHQSGAGDSHPTARLHEPCEGVEIQIIREWWT